MVQAAAYHESRHLNVDDTYDAMEECPVCLSGGERKAVVRLQEYPPIELLECSNCRAYSASLMPRPEVLKRYYAEYYKFGQERNTCPNSTRFAARIAGHLKFSSHVPLIRILDFGGGDGSLARKIADRLIPRINRPVEIDVVDYAKPHNYDSRRLRIRGYGTLEEVSGPYNLIIASAVLEHIPELHPVLCRLFTSVGLGGFFYARTPYIVPFARLIHSLDFTYPGHVHDLGAGFWNRIGRTFGLDANFLFSGPSLVETTLASHPWRTLLAATLKIPAKLEQLLSKHRRVDPWWTLVGGWEVMLQLWRNNDAILEVFSRN
jgi:methyltransferase family protein